jgi:hypothetical protein
MSLILQDFIPCRKVAKHPPVIGMYFSVFQVIASTSEMLHQVDDALYQLLAL